MKIYNITDYGAVYSQDLQTEKIQKAIDDCFLGGGGRVLIPCGIYRTGGLRLRSGVELYLESGAILQGSHNPEDYLAFIHDSIEPVTMEPVEKTPSTVATSRWCNGLIRVLDAKNVSIVGEKGSYIDGVNCYDPQGEEKYRGPHGISIWRSENIHLEGYTFINSANWCHAIFQSKNITARNLTVHGGHDGFDVRTCDNILIENCIFNVGDDSVAGFDNHDMIVRNCVLNTACQSMRLGGNNILVENCTSDARNFGFRFRLSTEEKAAGFLSNDNCRRACTVPFSYYCDHRAILRKPAENIVIRNFHTTQTKELIRLEFTGLHRWCCNRSLREITFENCSFQNLERAGMLWGDPNEKVICRFKNCTIVCKEGCEKEPILVAANFEELLFEDCTFEGWEAPTLLVGTDEPVKILRSTPIQIKKVSAKECMDAHPWGVVPEDREAGRTFKLSSDQA